MANKNLKNNQHLNLNLKLKTNCIGNKSKKITKGKRTKWKKKCIIRTKRIQSIRIFKNRKNRSITNFQSKTSNRTFIPIGLGCVKNQIIHFCYLFEFRFRNILRNSRQQYLRTESHWRHVGQNSYWRVLRNRLADT